ncbi:uncharacterized protein K02A2.6-like [Ornithodoros turicata]|uniref:uncharacterized protein K02A2.6-like n=1 Tax=Ornithodoros turicata TaxID=34597 RepID=UPI0031396405
MMFSKLDLNDGYHQLLLKEDCRHITTFATHMGLYRYKWLNFGINAAAELFQNTVRQVLAGIPGVKNISDDILRELTFFGHIFSEKGIKPDPAKVQGFLNMPPPRDVSEQYSFTVQHQKGSENPSDYMSRHPVGQTNPGFRTSKVPDEYVLLLSRIAVPRAINTEDVIKATLADVTCQELTQAIQACHSMRHDLWNKPHVKPYKPLETELSVTPQGLILRGTRLLPPSGLQERAVQLAHKGHMGMVKTKQLLRESVWFPKMDTLVEKAVRNWIPCQAVTDGPKRDPLKPTPLPEGPLGKPCDGLCRPISEWKVPSENSDEDDELPDDTRRDDPQNQTSNDPPDDDRHHDSVSAQDSGSPNRYPIRSSRGVPAERFNYT